MSTLTAQAQPLLVDTSVLIYHLKNSLSPELTEQLAHGLQLVTANTVDFQRIPGLAMQAV